MEKIYYSYEDFKTDILSLLPRLQENYDAVVTMARGGLCFAQAIAEAKNIRNIQLIQTALYNKTQKQSECLLIDNTDLSTCKHVLVVDDISDSGETLSKVMQHLQAKYPQITYETATLFYKRSSRYKPTYFIHQSSQWIDFFWEVDFNS